jgi:hypothetical protein
MMSADLRAKRILASMDDGLVTFPEARDAFLITLTNCHDELSARYLFGSLPVEMQQVLIALIQQSLTLGNPWVPFMIGQPLSALEIEQVNSRVKWLSLILDRDGSASTRRNAEGGHAD